MRKLLLLASFFFFALPALDANAAGTKVTIPDGTEVVLTTGQMLGSTVSPKGSTFQTVVTKDVVVNGFVVIKAGAKGQGTVIDSIFGDQQRMMPQEGDGSGVGKGPPIEIHFDWVEGVDGLKLRLGNVTTDGDSNGNPAQASPAPDYKMQATYKPQKRGIFNFNPTIVVNVKNGAGFIPQTQVFTSRIVGPVHTTTSIKAGDTSNDGYAH